jgi:hypothetical protein
VKALLDEVRIYWLTLKLCISFLWEVLLCCMRCWGGMVALGDEAMVFYSRKKYATGQILLLTLETICANAYQMNALQLYSQNSRSRLCFQRIEGGEDI